MQNFNSLGSLVLEISTFQHEACHRFRAGASVHKLFVGGVYYFYFEKYTVVASVQTTGCTCGMGSTVTENQSNFPCISSHLCRRDINPGSYN